MSRYEKAPTVNRGTNQKTLHRHSSTPINLMRERLDNPRKYGEGYRDACPAHEGKSRSSLSIKETDDGRVLLHCFAGCSALDVVHSLGLELSDLFERPIERPQTPQQRRELQQKIKMGRWKSVRGDLLIECQILLLGMGMAYRGEPISQEDMDRAVLAGKRIRSAMGEL
jgi:hypothetical protein